MPVLNRSLGQPPQQPPAAPNPAQIDPVQMLLDEYSRLEEKAAAKPMYSPEQRQQRVDSNNQQMELGVLGQMSGDRQIQGVGGGVLRQALSARQERPSARGVMNPLTGEETVSPEYKSAQTERRRDALLQKALGFQQQRDMQKARQEEAMRHDQFMKDLRLQIQEMRNANGGGGPNLVKVTDETDGQQFWADPKTGKPVAPLTKPGGAIMPPKPAKMTASDEKALSENVRAVASVQAALTAVDKNPNAFGMAKGAPQLLPGALGTISQAARDKRISSDDLAARSMVYNNISQIIKERAGTAQSTGEMKRLNSFLPSDLDDARAIKAKFTAFQQYLAEQGASIQGRYKGPRPTLHADPNAGPQAPSNPAATSAPKRYRFNPATGQLEE
jgi:hypothetical protein